MFLFIVMAVASGLGAFAPLPAASEELPNPVQVLYGFKGPERAYNVECWSVPGIPGTWLQVSGTTYTTQEALIYRPTHMVELRKEAILYCNGVDGKPGLIAGAPPQMVLPVGTRVQVWRTAEITVTSSRSGKRFNVMRPVPLDDETRIDADAGGIRMQQGPHRLTIYPAGTRVTVGGGFFVAYIRPNMKTAPPIAQTSAATGCDVSYIGNDGQAVRTVHYPQDCFDVPLTLQSAVH